MNNQEAFDKAYAGLADRLRALGACDPAVRWVAAQPDRRPGVLWPTCQDGSWSLWALERAGIDCSEMGFTCAERARQSALRALPPSPERDTLAACAPIVDRETASAALTAGCAASPVARAAEWAARATASRAARAAEWAAEAAAWAAEWVGAEAAAKAELAAIAELVRERWPVPPREVIEMLGGEG